MKQLPSRLRRLDDALAALPLDEPMLLSELDGFLTGILVSPEAVMPGEWLQYVWGSDEAGGAPFDDPLDVQWFTDAVIARHNEIARDLGRGRPQPIFDVDDRNGDVLWELWADGFAQAIDVRPDAWAALAHGSDTAAAIAVTRLSNLIAAARNESALDSVAINALHDDAPADLAACALELHAARQRAGLVPAVAVSAARPAKVGRNDPCRCGSGRKSKRCCG